MKQNTRTVYSQTLVSTATSKPREFQEFAVKSRQHCVTLCPMASETRPASVFITIK